MANHSDDEKPPWTKATVVDLKTFGSVNLLRLKVPDQSFTFKPGQWVDFNIPGVTPFTGYSMVSPPSLLASSGMLDLAVKYSDYPPTLWVHEKCKVGDSVKIRVGGGFYYTPSSLPQDVLLLAGGIGINPLYSILLEYLGQDTQEGTISLLYSGKSPADLMFKDDILEFAKSNSCFSAKMFSSQDSVKQGEKNYITEGRITEPDIQGALSKMDKATVQVFICGPPAFLDQMEQYCLSNGVEKHQVFYEKWW